MMVSPCSQGAALALRAPSCGSGAAHHSSTPLPTGTVAVWNLLTASPLQRVSHPDGSLQLYPFQCFLAHDHAVRSIEWCKANR